MLNFKFIITFFILKLNYQEIPFEFDEKTTFESLDQAIAFLQALKFYKYSKSESEK